VERVWFCALLLIYGLALPSQSLATAQGSRSPVMNSLFPVAKITHKPTNSTWRSHVEEHVRFRFFKKNGQVYVKVQDRSIDFEVKTPVQLVSTQELVFPLSDSIYVRCRLKNAESMNCHHVINSQRQPHLQQFSKIKTLQLSDLKLKPGGGERKSRQVTGSAAARG
jgi:hypothetical protein